MEKLFNVICQDLSRIELEKQNNLRMSDRGYFFYEDQKDQCKQKCLDVVESPNLGDFISQQHKGTKGNTVANSGWFSVSDPCTSSSQHHLSFLSETKAVQSDTINKYENLTPLEKSQEN